MFWALESCSNGLGCQAVVGKEELGLGLVTQLASNMFSFRGSAYLIPAR